MIDVKYESTLMIDEKDDTDYITVAMDGCNKLMIVTAHATPISSQLLHHDIGSVEIDKNTNMIYLYSKSRAMKSLITLDGNIDYNIIITSFCLDGMKMTIQSL